MGRPDPGGRTAFWSPSTTPPVAVVEPAAAVHPLWPVALIGLCYAGYIKGMPWLAGLGVDLTAVFLAVVGLGVAWQLVRRTVDSRILVAVAGLWLTFIVGAVTGWWNAVGPAKIALLMTVTLLCAVAPAAVLRTVAARRVFIYATVLAAGLMAVALLLAPPSETVTNFGRLSLEGSNSVATARLVGAGTVAALLMGLSSRRGRALWLAGAAAGAAVTVFVGSRGPFVAVVIAAIIVVLTARAFRGTKRLPAVVVGGIAVVGLLLFVTFSDNRAAARIAGLLSGASVDRNRLYLLHQSWTALQHHPLGVGWGGFAALPTDQAGLYGRFAYPHNLVLEIFVEGGWLAGVAFVTLVVWSLRGFLAHSVDADGVVLLGLGIYWLLAAQTSGDINANRITWVMLGLGLVLSADRWRRAADETIPTWSLSAGSDDGYGDRSGVSELVNTRTVAQVDRRRSFLGDVRTNRNRESDRGPA